MQITNISYSICCFILYLSFLSFASSFQFFGIFPLFLSTSSQLHKTQHLRTTMNFTHAFSSSHTAPSSIGRRAKILLLGSSMTQRSFSIEHQGWGSYLAQWYSRSADVLNRGSGGYNSRWLRQFVPQILAAEESAPDMTVLFIGNNDAIHETEMQHVPLSDYRENIETILRHLHSVRRNMIVLLVTTTPVNEHLKPLHSNDRRRRYADVVRDIIRDHETVVAQMSTGKYPLTSSGEVEYLRPRFIGLVDLWEASEHEAVTIEDLHDGSHLDKNGNKKVFETMRRCINEVFPFFSPDHLVIPRNQLRARKSSFSSDASKTASSFPLKPFAAASDSLAHASDDEWWKEPSLHLTLPPWHTLSPPDWQPSHVTNE